MQGASRFKMVPRPPQRNWRREYWMALEAKEREEKEKARQEQEREDQQLALLRGSQRQRERERSESASASTAVNVSAIAITTANRERERHGGRKCGQRMAMAVVLSAGFATLFWIWWQSAAFFHAAGHATTAVQRHGCEAPRTQPFGLALVPEVRHARLRHPRHHDAYVDGSSYEASFSRRVRMRIAAIVTCGTACTQRSSTLRGSLSSPSTCRATSEGGADESANQENEQPKGWRFRFAAWCRSDAKMDRNQLAKMGLVCLLSYAWVSNTNVVILMITSTYRAMVATGARPLNNAAALKQFGITYVGFHVISHLIRRIRINIALAIAPVFGHVRCQLDSKVDGM